MWSVMLSILCGEALAWETMVYKPNPYLSLFPERINISQNEHALLADEVLVMLDPRTPQEEGRDPDRLWTMSERWGMLTGVRETNRTRIVDLHTSWLRYGEVRTHTGDGDIEGTPLFERSIPHASMFAGLPDVAYSLPDWLTRLTVCPPFGRNKPGCYAFDGWLGALNSTHFGHLAVETYGRHHAQAMREAQRARALRERVDPDFHKDAIREAEDLAMIFEMTGQHFLQDRWAAGHMWSRWGAGEPNGRKIATAQTMALLTGITHGTYAIFQRPDPMGLPSASASGEAAQWGYPRVNGLGDTIEHTDRFDGIGDDAWVALRTDQAFDIEVDVAFQREMLMTCAAGGIRSVISAFGSNGAGTYGIDQLPLPEKTALENERLFLKLGFSPYNEGACTDASVTNATFYEGISTLIGSEETELHGLVVIYDVVTDDSSESTIEDGAKIRMGPSYLPLHYKAWRFAETNPNGFDAAHHEDWGNINDVRWEGTDWAETLAPEVLEALAPNGRVRSISKWKGNNAFDLPAYYGEASVDEWLEEDDDIWLDQKVMAGTFHHAFSEHWCQQLGETLGALRDEIRALKPGNDRDRLSAVCATMAMKAYRGVPLEPENPIAAVSSAYEQIGEHLPFDRRRSRYGRDYEPICKYLPNDLGDELSRGDDLSDDVPYQLHRGYVNVAGEQSQMGDFPSSLINWCQRIPALDRIRDPQAPDLVGRVERDDGDRFVRLNGRNLGLRTGSGAVGLAEMVAEDRRVVTVNVWDPIGGVDGGGWSDNGRFLDVRIPLSNDGFPSWANPGMRPDEIVAQSPRPYPITLHRPKDEDADPRFLANGAETVGPNQIGIYPSWVELTDLDFALGGQQGAIWVIYPQWLRDKAEILANGFYRVAESGEYVPLNVPFDFRPGGYYTFDSNDMPVFNTSPEHAGVLFDVPDDLDNVVYFFAYH